MCSDPARESGIIEAFSCIAVGVECSFLDSNIEVTGVPFRGNYLKFLSTCQEWDTYLNEYGPWKWREYGGRKTIENVHKPSAENNLKKEQDNLDKARILLDKTEQEITNVFEKIQQECALKLRWLA